VIYLLEREALADYLARKIRVESKITEKALSGMTWAQEDEKRKLYEIDQNGDAHITITGILTNARSFWDMFFGEAASLTYDEIFQAAIEADENPGVKRIIFDINSPGGRVDGLDDAAQAIAAVKKPTVARVRDMAASGAYWLASQADRIEVTSPVATVGSIGVMATVIDDTKMLEDWGLKDIIITSTDAPKKYVDPTTKKGQEEIRNVLDGIHAVFASRVAEGRGVSVEMVNSNFGQGALLIAEDALEIGMIDKIDELEKPTEGVAPDEAAPQAAKTKNKGVKMTLEEFRAENPGLYAEVLKEGREIGVSGERKRVSALMSWAENVPECKEIVAEAIISGKSMEEAHPLIEGAIRKAAQAGKDGKGSDGDDTPGDVATGTVKTGSGETGEGEEPDKVQLDAFREKIRKIG